MTPQLSMKLDVTKLCRPDQILFLKNRLDCQLTQQPRLQELSDRLIEAGGGLLVSQNEEDLDNILNRTVIFNHFKKPPLRMIGRPSECHFNASRCWEANPKISRIATGYGLSEDGLWRQHTWVVKQVRHGGRKTFDSTNPGHWQVYETTLPRLCYFGFILTLDECAKFAFDNL